jgi:cyclophilin family peptidyl-prolyl cis-trans isomerase
MKKTINVILLFSVLLSFEAPGQNISIKGPRLPDGLYAIFRTNKGQITVSLDYKSTPMTVANFVGLAEGTITNTTYPLGTPFFNGSIWHRVVKGHVIQGGEPSVVTDPANKEESSTGYEIPNEISHLSHNKAGMIGMANGGPHTNTCQYYITLADRSYLDGNYTLFGEVFAGMDVVNMIEMGDTTFSISIERIGVDARNFIMNDKIFADLVSAQWKKVNYEKQKRIIADNEFISGRYPDLIKSASGLRYKVKVKGNGKTPVDGSVVNLSYEGILTNGVKFVSSAGGKPAYGEKAGSFDHVIGAAGLVPGLEEALMDMKAGERRILVIPPELGYGQNSAYYGKEIPGKKRLVISPGEILILSVILNKLN